MFIDQKTPRPFVDPTIPWQRNVFSEDHGAVSCGLMSAHKLTHVAEAKDGAALIDHIYMDAMGFGMGCSCLQLTFQSCNIAEARRLYDALVPVAPLMVS